MSKGESNPVVGVEMGGKVHSNISSSSEGWIVLCLRWLQSRSESLIQHKVSSQGRDYNSIKGRKAMREVEFTPAHKTSTRAVHLSRPQKGSLWDFIDTETLCRCCMQGRSSS
ncbi:unnamed protein product [Lepidochelys olivacea]